MKLMTFKSLLVLGTALIASNLYAWGPLGHKIVGEIAQMNLTPKAEAELKKILPNTTLAEVSTWADLIKSESQWQSSKPWHFVNVPDGETYADINKDPQGDVISATNGFIKTLEDKSASNDKKAEAVKFLVHLIGDIHQPLHVGRIEDRGGNNIDITFFDRPMNLHSLWDSGLIEYQHIGVKEYAIKLSAIKSAEADSAFTYADILREDMSLRKQVYDFKDPVLGKEYFDKNLNTLNSRLLLAGKRLAQVFNAVFK